MNCRDARAQMLDDSCGSLSESSRRALVGHVATCPACAVESADIRRGWSALDMLPDERSPAQLRATVLGAVESRRRTDAVPATSRLVPVLGGLVAAVATVTLLVGQDPDCRSPVSIACCGALWVVAYAVAFALLGRKSSGDATRALVGRGLLAAAGGLLLVRMCPGESGELIPLPFLTTLAEQASSSLWSGFTYGALLGAMPLVLTLIVVRLRRPTVGAGVRSAGIQFLALAPALYLASSYLALVGLLAVLTGAAVGALTPALFEAWLRGSAFSRGSA